MANDKEKELLQLLNQIKKAQTELAKLQSNMTEGDKIQAQLIREKKAQLKELVKTQKEFNKEIDDALLSFEDLDDATVSIGNTLKNNNKIVDKMSTKFSFVKQLNKSIGDELKAGAVTNQKTQKQVIAATQAYQNMQLSIANIEKQKAQGLISEEERISMLKQEASIVENILNSIDMTKVSSETLTGIIKGMKDETQSFAAEMSNAQVNSERLDNLFGSFQGIPAMSEMSTLLKTNIKDTVAFKAAVFALGAALGKAAMDYFGAGIKAQNQAYHEQQVSRIDNEAEIAKMEQERGFVGKKIDEERNSRRIESENQINELVHEAAYASQKAAIQFGASMQSAAAEFNAASKTALFGNKLGGVGYGAAQLQMAGISADKIASAMQAAANATGKMPTGKMGADMAIMADRTGTSVDNIAQINEYFERTDKVSADVAINMQEGLRNMADQAGLNLGKLMQEVADASKEALSYNIKSGPALAKQVAYAQSLGVSFGDIAKAGKNMVMNYKDSIKAEMQLSTLLGKQVDLSEVRAKFAEGDQEGALKALREQGLQLEDMDMFQKQALQDSLGGLDLESISKVTSKEGTEPGALKAGNAGKANQEFMGKKVAAEASLQAQQAQISANTAVIDAKLQQQISDSYMASPEYATYQQNLITQKEKEAKLQEEINQKWLGSLPYLKKLEDLGKEDFKNGIRESIISGFAMLAGGLVTSMISGLFGGGGGGMLGKLFGKKGKRGKGGGGGDVSSDDGMSSISGKAGDGKNVVSKMLDGLKEIVKSINGVLQEGLQLVKDVGGKLIETASDLLKKSLGLVKDTVNELIETLSSTLQNSIQMLEDVGTKAVKAVGNIGEQVVDSVGGILKKVGPVVKELGGIFETLGESVGKVLGTLGRGIGTLLEAVFKGIAAGLTAWANPTVAIGAAVFAAAILVIGAAIAGATWMIGKALPTMAEGMKSFESLDGDRLKDAGLGIAAIGGGLAVFAVGGVAAGVGSIIGGLTGAIGKLFGAKSPIDQLKEFNDLNINGKRVKENAEAFAAFGVAMTKSGIGSAASGIGTLVGGLAEGVGKFFGAKPPLDKFYDFAHTDYGDPEKTKSNAEAFTMFGQAMASYKGTGESTWSKLGDGILSFFGGGGGGVSGVIKDFKEFAQADMGDTKKLKANAEAFTTFGNAMASYTGDGRGLSGVLAEGIGDFLGVDTPLDKFKTFAQADLGDTDKLKSNAEAFTTFGTAMSSYKPASPGLGEMLGQAVGKFFGIPTPLQEFERFSAANIDKDKTASNAEAFTLFANAMAGYKSPGESGWSAIGKGIGDFFSGGKVDIINEFQRFAALDSVGITNTSNAIASLNTNLAGWSTDIAETVASGMETLGTGVTTFLSNGDLASGLNDFNSAFVAVGGSLTTFSEISAAMDESTFALHRLADAFRDLAGVDVKALNDLPWLRLIAFAGAGGAINMVQSANKSFNLTQDTAKKIDQMNTTTTQMLQVNKNLQALLDATLTNNGESGAISLMIDGRQVTKVIKRRTDNNQGQSVED